MNSSYEYAETFVVEKQSAIVSNLISYKLFHEPDAVEYPLPNVSGRILSLVLEFCTTHTATLSFGGAGGLPPAVEARAKARPAG